MPAESETARHFAELAHTVATHTATPAQHKEVKSWLDLWAGNDRALAPMLTQRALTMELEEVSRNLSRTAAIGLADLDQIEGHSGISHEADAEQQRELKELEKLTPAALRNMAVGPGEELLAATQ